MNSLKFAKNVILSLVAQAISMLVGIVLNLIVPKYISELSYSYWQSYLLYAGYVGILHFGLLDGLVLRYSQYDLDQLDKPRIRSQFLVLLLISNFMAIISFGISFYELKGDIFAVFVFVSSAIVIKNLYTYISYTFQITNRISKYAFFVISDRLIYGLIVICLLVFGVDDFKFYCLADLGSDLIAIVISVFYNKILYFGKLIKFSDAFNEAKFNVFSGCMLLISNWSAILLLGSTKMFVQWYWDHLVFGKISFAFSLSNLVLQFVGAVSVVLFPSLKRTDTKDLPDLYKKIRGVINPLLFVSLLMYFPAAFLLKIWIPTYQSSLEYIGILFPMIVFTSKVNLLTNNYFNAYRKEKQMLVINVSFVMVAFLSLLLCAKVLNSLNALLIVTVVILMLRSIVSELIITRIIKVDFSFEFIYEVLLTFVFICCSTLLSVGLGLFTFLIAIIVYLIIHKSDLNAFRLVLKNRHSS